MKKHVASPFRKIISRRLAEIFRGNDQSTQRLEQWIREYRGNEPTHFPFEILSKPMQLVARVALALDPSGLQASAMRKHKQVIKGCNEPHIREYFLEGYRVTHDIRHVNTWASYIRGCYQPGINFWLKHYARADGVAIDIGANVGVFSLALARATANSGVVFAFEPNPDTFRTLEETITENGLEKVVHPFNLAVSNHSASTWLHVPRHNNGEASLEHCKDDSRDVLVNVVKFNDWWNSEGRPTPYLIKIDVEGHEGPVIQALHDCVKETRPVLIIELSFANNQAKSIIDDITALGYTITEITDYPPYKREMTAITNQTFDVLCEPISVTIK